MKTSITQNPHYQFSWYRIILFSVFIVLTGIYSFNVKGQTVVPLTLTINAVPISASIFPSGNYDIYRFTTPGGIWRAYTKYTMQTYGSLNTYMYLYRLSGSTPVILAQDDNSGIGNNAKITYTVNPNSTYYIRVRANPNTITGNYKINVINATTYPPVTSLQGTPGPGQVTLKWTAPTLRTPTGYKVYASSTQNGIYYYIAAATSTQLTYTFGSTLWYYVTALFGTVESSPTSEIRVIPIPVVSLIVGDQVGAHASISTASEADWYCFYASTPGNYTIETYNLSTSTINTFMSLYNAANRITPIASDNDSGDGVYSRISRSLQGSLWYYVKITALYPTTGNYSIRVMGPKYLNVSPTNVTIGSASGSSGTFTITSNTTWNITDNALWLTVSPVTGSNNRTITVTASSANPGPGARSATVTVVGSGVTSKTVTVTQQGPTPTVGTNLGNTTVGNLMNNTATNRRAMQVTFPETGTIRSISIYHNGNVGGQVLLGVYSNASGAPSALLGVPTTATISLATEWQTINLTSRVTVASGQTVWLSWVFQATNPNPGVWFEASTTAGAVQSSASWSGGMPATFGASTPKYNRYSIYCTYTPGALGVDNTPGPGVAKSSDDLLDINSNMSNKEKLLIYPNPTDGSVTVTWDNYYDRRLILTIYNSQGSPVKKVEVEPSINQIQVDLNNNQKGLYLLELRDMNGIIINRSRIVKQ
jgi:hypothetical protein